MILGYYSDLGYSRRVQKLFKLYCFIIPLIVLGVKLSTVRGYPNFIFLYDLLELCSNYYVSLCTDNIYLTDYYSLISTVDEDADSKKSYLKLKKMYIFISTVLVLDTLDIVFTIFVAFRYYQYDIILILCKIPLKLHALAGRLPITLIFSLFYCRVNNFRKMVTNTYSQILSTRNDKDKQNKCLNVYIWICKSLEKSGLPLKLLVILKNTSFYFI